MGPSKIIFQEIEVSTIKLRSEMSVIRLTALCPVNKMEAEDEIVRGLIIRSILAELARRKKELCVRGSKISSGDGWVKGRLLTMSYNWHKAVLKLEYCTTLLPTTLMSEFFTTPTILSQTPSFQGVYLGIKCQRIFPSFKRFVGSDH